MAEEVTGMKFFRHQYRKLQEVKRELINNAVEAGVNKSSSMQLVINRLDAKLEEAILYTAHADGVIQFFNKLAGETAAKGGAVDLSAEGDEAASNVVQMPSPKE